MSFADELRQAEKRLKNLAKEETTRAKGSRRKTGGGSGGGTGPARSTEWKVEDEIIALYLQMSESSKFLKENYSTKRKISSRSMALRMGVFASLMKGVEPDGLTEQTKLVFKKFSRMPVKELQKLVISILRGDNDPAEVSLG